MLKDRVLKKTGKIKKFIKKFYFPVFIIKFVTIVLGLRSLLLLTRHLGKEFGSGWYVCHNHTYMSMTIRYALILGVGYSVFDWIAGCLTNYKIIFGLFFLIYREYLHGFVLEKKHYIFLFRLFGFNIIGFCLPIFIFLPRMLESRITNYEAGCFDANSLALIDSNALSGDTLLPLTSNDDSIISINFFFYIFTLHMLKKNINFCKKWYTNIRNVYKRKFFWTLYYFIFFTNAKNYNSYLKKFSKHFLFFYKEPFFYYDTNQILGDLMPFATFKFLIGYEINSDMNFLDKFVFEYNYK